MRVAIVEDDLRQAQGLFQVLRNHSTAIDMEVFHQGKPFLRRLSQEPFDLALIDLQLPDVSGFFLMERLRARQHDGGHTPTMVVVSGCAKPNTLQRSFDCGAADFVLKPYRSDELIIRILHAAKQKQPRLFDDRPIDLGPIHLNLGTQQALVNGREVHLSAKEFKIAWLLFSKAGQPVSRSQLMQLVWGRVDSPYSRSLDTHIGRLRQKLGLHDHGSIRLRPEYGMGYRVDFFS
jgi:DNA-binding response OmpR family regulator